MSIVALAIATIVPLVFLYLIYTLDLYGTGAFRTVALCFLWGGVAFVLAYGINTLTLNYNLVSFENFQRFSAPVIEEILKALILVYLVRRPNFTYFVDGAIYGFAAGIGFAIFENYSYILSNPGTALGIAIGRVLSTNLIHATASAIVGIALGLARFQRGGRRWLLLALGLALAMTLHIIFNNLVTRVESSLLLLYAATVGFSGTGAIVYAIRRGLAEEKIWIEEKLGDADRVTSQEAAAVQQLGKTQKLLAPLAERFGPQKAADIEKFLVLQARLGILRKTLDKLSNDEKMSKAVRAQMDELRQQMEAARRSVGAYCMLYLRNIFPPDSSPLWNRLESLIQESIAARPATGGANHYAALQQRLTRPNPSGEAKPD